MSGEMRISLFVLGVLTLFYVALVAIGISPLKEVSLFANLGAYAAAWIVVTSVHALTRLAQVRPERPIRYLRDVEFGADYRRRFREVAPLLMASVLFMPAFSIMKTAIPIFNAYNWDPLFINIDQRLHGQDPWRLLQLFFGYPILTSALSLAYQVWILLIYVGTVYFALYVPNRRLRLRFFAANFAIWTINGVMLATLLSSVGPCFAGPILGNWHFSEQMAYLHNANQTFPVMVLDVQQILLDRQFNHSRSLGSGITAMPSMHVALAFLFYLATRQINGRLGTFFFLFFLTIMIGSVHLAYHYAIDGYVSIIVTATVWLICGRLFREADGQGSKSHD